VIKKNLLKISLLLLWGLIAALLGAGYAQKHTLEKEGKKREKREWRRFISYKIGLDSGMIMCPSCGYDTVLFFRTPAYYKVKQQHHAKLRKANIAALQRGELANGSGDTTTIPDNRTTKDSIDSTQTGDGD